MAVPPRTPSESAPTESTPSGSAPTESTPSGSAPTKSTPSGRAPSESTPSGSAPSGSAPSGRAQPGTVSRNLQTGGATRTYLLHLPATLAAQRSLVVVLHGGFGSAQQAEAAYGWDELADRDGVLVAYPQGDGAAWNAGDCCGAPARKGIDDVAFIAAVVADVQARYGVTQARTFVTGMSNGALMAYRLACDTDLFAAVAAVAGTIVTGCAHPAPLAVLHIHGLDDDRVRFGGGTGRRRRRGGRDADPGRHRALAQGRWLLRRRGRRASAADHQPLRLSRRPCCRADHDHRRRSPMARRLNPSRPGRSTVGRAGRHPDQLGVLPAPHPLGQSDPIGTRWLLTAKGRCFGAAGRTARQALLVLLVSRRRNSRHR